LGKLKGSKIQLPRNKKDKGGKKIKNAKRGFGGLEF
jgi:hypothetical protein